MKKESTLSRNIFVLAIILFLCSCSSEQTTSEKLEKIFDRFEEAKKIIIERNYKDKDPISRFRFEWILDDLFSSNFSESDLENISIQHKKIIEESAKIAKNTSIIDLNVIRDNPTAVSNLCQEIPKGGMLHVHPWGLFSKDIVRNILLQSDPLLQTAELVNLIENKDPGQFLYEHEKQLLLSFPQSTRFSELSPEQQDSFLAMFVLPSDPEIHDFQRFDSIFAFVDWLLGSENRNEKLLLAYEAFLENASASGVSYVEFTNYYSPNIENIRLMEDWSQKFYEQTGVIVRWNISFLRFEPGEENAYLVKEWNNLLLNNPTDVITGIDLLSLERGYPALEQAQDIYGYIAGFNAENPDHPLEMTMHAGELGDIRNVRDAILMGASRIGHGVLLVKDPVTLEYARRIRLPVEINIVSNHKLGVHNMYESQHPFLDYLRLGLQVSLSTDNDAIFETDIVNECRAVVSTTNIEYSELKSMNYNSINTSFADKTTKQKLLGDLDERFKVFENQYRILN